MANKIDLNYPKNIKLETSPLVEAWLTIQWKVEPAEEGSPFVKGASFNLVVGKFYELIKEEFGIAEPLDASQLPEQALPHNPRYRFRPTGKNWPVLQLGTAVATVNYVDDYNWEKLKKEALYLREKLIEAYPNKSLDVSLLSLRYRNAIHFEYSKQEMLEFLEGQLHIKLEAPRHIPGDFAARNSPAKAGLSLTYNLATPLARGILRINTGTHKVEDEEIESLIVDTEIVSTENMQVFQTKRDFSKWLEEAHTVAHEWFFAIVDGELLEKYKSKQG
jgi:uncharacterized protein (TIGR04255 family)